MRSWFMAFILIVGLVGCDSAEQTPPASNAENPLEAALPNLFEANIGTVNFPVRCTADAARVVERGLTLLHHMMYENARLAFGMAENLDGNCPLALWGQAMTIIHPLWPDRPTAQELKLGNDLARRATAMAAGDPREAGYLSTVSAYFANLPGETERDRLARFAEAWQKVAADNPTDLEAQALFALAYLATAELSDKSLVKNHRAGDIATRILQQVPDHPGAHHYLIHAYDHPQLAARALPVADRYGAMTPAVPHATHMMTHIYTRLGQWRKSVEWNQKSADSAWELCTELGEILPHYQHALDYLAYAHLQMGHDSRVLEIVDDLSSLEAPFSTLNRASAAYAFAALPARYNLERADWIAAAELKPRAPAGFPWEETHDPYVAITHFARAMGNAKLGRSARARLEIQRLAELREAILPNSAYWGLQVEIQMLSAQAWTQYAEGTPERALATMQQAVELEAATEKSPTTPGAVLPAMELLGDMLSAIGDHNAALEAYERSLTQSPGRLNSLYGAAQAAEAAKLNDVAAKYYTATLAMLSDSTERTAIIRAARNYLEG